MLIISGDSIKSIFSLLMKKIELYGFYFALKVKMADTIFKAVKNNSYPRGYVVQYTDDNISSSVLSLGNNHFMALDQTCYIYKSYDTWVWTLPNAAQGDINIREYLGTNINNDAVDLLKMMFGNKIIDAY
jgi:hypothetical protein